MITRRGALRGFGLAAMAIGAGGILDACAQSTDDPPPTPKEEMAVTLASSDLDRATPDPAALAGGVASMHALGAGLWAELGAAEGNLAISPYSVAVALAMTANGAKAKTLYEMIGVLWADSVASLNAGFNAVTQHVESLAGPVERWEDDDAEIALDAANALFAQQGVKWEQAFLDALATSYGAGVQQVDYVTATEAARTAINTWTADRTRDRIPELVPAGALEALTRLVLVNALYLKAPWDVPFEEEMTIEGDFHLVDGSTVEVPLMRGGATSPARGQGWVAVRIPYAGSELAMTVVLPDEGRAADVEAMVTRGEMGVFFTQTSSATVSLTMPRWTFRTPSPLNDALQALGMERAFDEGAADFSGMTTEERLHVSAVLHEVFIAVDEAGTEAAAATAVVMAGTSAPDDVLEVVLDRPFLFVIHDVEHGTPLFVGRVANPS
ncbi:serpin family protein [Nocardioides sp.]|uniref:serpin family protein n=1 Tax=Nocardioides sp. TaxID=35761 RepID=UPI003566B38A